MGPWVGLELKRWRGGAKTQFRSPSAAGGDVPATARQQGTGKIMLGRARSRAQALARLPCRVPHANNIRRPSGSITVARPADRGHHRVPPGLCAGARTADPRRRSGPGRAPCRSRCPTRRRRQASAPSCRAAARPTAPPARHHVLLPRGPRRRRVGSSPGVSGGPLPAVRQPRQDQSSSSSGLRFSATQLAPPPSSSSSRRSPTPCAFNRRSWSTKSTSVSRAISRRGVAAPASGVPGGGLFFAVPSFASRRF